MKWKKLEMPKRVIWNKETLTETYGSFYAEPFERGYAITIGNSLRRILLSSIQAAAVASIKIDGVHHEFSTVEGVLEDVTHIILNIKDLKLNLNVEGPKTIRLSVKGEKEVKAGDIVTDGEVEVINKNLHIATLTASDAKLNMEMEVNSGRGYASAEKNKKENQPIGVIPIDAIFTPVRKVKFSSENTRVGQMTDYDKLVMEIWTDGRIRPEDALAHAAKILKDHLTIFINFEEETEEEVSEKKVDEGAERMKELLSRSINELELSVRAANCLKVDNIKTIEDLVKKSETDLLKYRNFGRKSLNEIKDMLLSMGLSLAKDKGEEKTVLEKEKPEKPKAKEKGSKAKE